MRLKGLMAIPPEDGVVYTIRPGDHLADVAERYGVSLDAIIAENQIGDANLVQAGVDVFLPGGRPIAASGNVQAVAEPAPDEDDQAAALAAPPIPLQPEERSSNRGGRRRSFRRTHQRRGPCRLAARGSRRAVASQQR